MPSLNRKTNMTHHDAYIAKMKSQLDELNAHMTKLDAQAKSASEEVRATYQAEMNKLRECSAAALAKFEEIKVASEASWKTMVTEMEKVRDAFTSSFAFFKTKL